MQVTAYFVNNALNALGAFGDFRRFLAFSRLFVIGTRYAIFYASEISWSRCNIQASELGGCDVSSP